MTQPDQPQEPAPEREEKHSAPDGLRWYSVGLPSPQGPAEQDPENLVEIKPVDHAPGCDDEENCVVHGGKARRNQLGWPYDQR